MKFKNLSKKMAAFILTTILAGTLSAPLPVQAAEWKKDGNGWRWQEDNGSYSTSKWKKINGKWYHFNASGYMDTGWYQKGISWYYLGDANDGAMKTGWHQINGKWYCFGDGDSGVMRSGWYTEGENTYFLGNYDDGAMKTGWQYVADRWYYFHPDGKVGKNEWIGDYYINYYGYWFEEEKEENHVCRDVDYHIVETKYGNYWDYQTCRHCNKVTERPNLEVVKRSFDGIDEWINTHITSEMTDYEKVSAALEYFQSCKYKVGGGSAFGEGTGDCYTGNYEFSALCSFIGVETQVVNATWMLDLDPTKYRHYVTYVLIDGEHYVVDATPGGLNKVRYVDGIISYERWLAYVEKRQNLK